MNSLKLLHTISGIWEHTGGPAESVPRLCNELVKAGNQVILATLDGPLSSAAIESRNAGVVIKTYPHIGQISVSIFNAMGKLVKDSDLVHGHGLWLPINWATGISARGRIKPLVITLRGSLNLNALQHSRWKKHIAGMFFDNGILRSASCLHATSVDEYQAVRSYGLNNPVAIIPNGVDMALFERLPSSAEFMQRYKIPADKKVLLYLSRLSWEKGLEDLAEAWGNVAAHFQDWVLLIVGQGTQGYEAKLKSLFQEKAGSDRVKWAGMLTGTDKMAAYAAANLFVLPSHTENFSLVTAEALAAGIPVITTHGTPWSELVDNNCGWWVPIGVKSLTDAFEEALTIPESKLREMGQCGKVLIASKYTWGQIAGQITGVYSWILSGGSTPTCVRLD